MNIFEKDGCSPSFMVLMQLWRIYALFVIKRGYARQLLTLEEFKGRSAARGNVRHFVGKSKLFDGCRAVSAADNRRRGRFGKRFRDCPCAARKGRYRCV